MKIDISNTKFFTIFLSILYILGLVCVFYKCELLLAFIVLLFLLFLVIKTNLSHKRIIILYFIFFFGLIRANYSNNFESILDDVRANNVAIEGQIIDTIDVSKKNNRIKFFLRADKVNLNGKDIEKVNSKILVNLDLDNRILNEILVGDYIKVIGNLRVPKEATNPYQFDYKKYLLNKNCKSILYAKNETLVKINPLEYSDNLKQNWYYILRKFEIKRNEIIKKHSQNIKSPNLEILGGIVFGDEAVSPDEEIKENFRNAGLLHLLAASGLNVALIYGIWWWIASLLRFPYNLSIFSGAVFVILYTFMTGFPPSILRASLMLLFVLFGKMINRNADSVALVFFVGFLILLVEPKMLFDVGFQLSFVVTLGLLVACPVLISKFDELDKKFKEKYKNLPRISKYFLFLFSPSALVGIVAVPLVAQICVMPLQIYYFNNIAPYSLLANIAVVPFIGILSFIGFVSSIFALIPLMDKVMLDLFDFIANPLLTLLVKISEIFSSFKYSLVSTCGISLFQVFCFWLISYILILNIKKNFRNEKLILLLMIFVFALILSFCTIKPISNNLEILMFDVGNADSFLIKTPENKYIIIDTGMKNFKGTTNAKSIINKYFKNKKINKIEKMIVTHFDIDHSGGVVDIINENKVNEVIMQNSKADSLSKKEILEVIKEKNLKNKYVKNNEVVYQEKDLIIKTFALNNQKIKDENEASIITLVSYKDKNILFMADANAQTFFELEKYIPSEIDVLKIGHHGAKGSIDKKMLDRIKPKYALISVGENKFNHPHFSVIELLLNNEIKMIATKNYGFVKVKIDDDIEFYHFDSKDRKFKTIEFNQNVELPFHKSKYMQNFIKNNI